MSHFTRRHYGYSQQMRRTKTSCVIQRIGSEFFQYDASQWQTILHQQYADCIRECYFSWQHHHKVKQSRCCWFVQYLTEHYREAVCEHWQLEQACYRHRVPFWEKHYKQAWYWQHTGRLFWKGEVWHCQVTQRQQYVTSYCEQAHIYQQQAKGHRVLSARLCDVVLLKQYGCFP